MAALTEAKMKATLLKHAQDRKSYGEPTFLVGADDAGELWYTNSYYAAKVQAKAPNMHRPAAVAFLAAYNLEPACAVYPVNGTVQAPNGADGPRISPLIPAADVWRDIVPVEVGGRAVLMHLDKLCRVYGETAHPMVGSPVAVNDAYMEWLEDTAGVVRWAGQVKDGAISPLKPVGGFNEGGELVAIVMPVRIH